MCKYNFRIVFSLRSTTSQTRQARLRPFYMSKSTLMILSRLPYFGLFSRMFTYCLQLFILRFSYYSYSLKVFVGVKLLLPPSHFSCHSFLWFVHFNRLVSFLILFFGPIIQNGPSKFGVFFIEKQQ